MTTQSKMFSESGIDMTELMKEVNTFQKKIGAKYIDMKVHQTSVFDLNASTQYILTTIVIIYEG